MSLSSNSFIGVSWGSLSIDLSPVMGHIFLLLHMCGFSLSDSGHCDFALWDVEYVCVCMKVSDLCSGLHLSYLEIADPSLLDFQYLEPLFLSLILSNFSFVLGGELNPVLVSLSSPEVEVEGV